MLQSKLFTKTFRDAPKDEESLNAKLLARGGFIYKNSAGVYSYLPLGWRVIQNIARIIREEMNAIGGEEIFMPALVEKKYWDATGRWDVEVGYEVLGKKEKKSSFILGWSHEDLLTAMAAKYVSSYKDLPFATYQIQTKFRNEPRAKSGLLRGKEFMMKDLYSFHADENDLNEYYEKVAEAYHRIFARCGLKAVYTLAAGGVFTTGNTHEFQVLADVGEDTIYLCEKCGYAENEEISELKDKAKCVKCGGQVKAEKAIEVGNIFPLGTKYSKAVNLKFRDKDGEEKLVVMGSYGIGLGRVMGTIAEVSSDERGLIWPYEVAPFKLHLLELNGASAKKLYAELLEAGVDTLYDERDASAGAKLTDADLMGIPYRAVVSPKNGTKIELKARNKTAVELVDSKELIKLLRASMLHRLPDSDNNL
ncbi:MAG: aminoacyl--tRNA ligase-related protein [Candidatus Liptonbacteria bacterium]|nr:aminoacyl--tRNA ligase-related protein [Candidatus Liptonbacteria bacterium]